MRCRFALSHTNDPRIAKPDDLDLGIPGQQEADQAAEMRQMPDEHDRSLVAPERCGNLVDIIFRAESLHGLDPFRRAQPFRKDHGGLFGTPFSAVPDLIYAQSHLSGPVCHSPNNLCSLLDQGSFRVVGFWSGLAVLNQEECHRSPPQFSIRRLDNDCIYRTFRIYRTDSAILFGEQGCFVKLTVILVGVDRFAIDQSRWAFCERR